MAEPDKPDIFVAAMGRLILVASQLDQARPWIDRRPPVHA